LDLGVLGMEKALYGFLQTYSITMLQMIVAELDQVSRFAPDINTQAEERHLLKQSV
jgi:hypothetical protein